MPKLKAITPKTYGAMDSFPKKDEKHYPSFSISLANFPLAKDWEVGKNYFITMRVRQSELEQRKNGKGNASFEILAIGGEENSAKKSKRYPRKK